MRSTFQPKLELPILTPLNNHHYHHSFFTLFALQLPNPTGINTFDLLKTNILILHFSSHSCRFLLSIYFFLVLVQKNISYSYPISQGALQSYRLYVSFFMPPFPAWDKTYIPLLMSTTVFCCCLFVCLVFFFVTEPVR